MAIKIEKKVALDTIRKELKKFEKKYGFLTVRRAINRYVTAENSKRNLEREIKENEEALTKLKLKR